MKSREQKELKEFVKKQLKKMREGSTTGNVASYSTPRAFVGDEDADEPTSFNVQDDQYAYSIKAPKERKNSIKLHEVSYKAFKMDETKTSVQKVNQNILEVAKRLGEVARMLNHSIKLKTEHKLPEAHWKRTNEALVKIHERISELTQRANQLYNLNEATAQSIKQKLVELFNRAGIRISPQDVDYNQIGTDHYEFDVMILGEPQAIDYNKGEIYWQAYDEEIRLGNLNQEQELVQNLTKEFKQ
jgi:hypothetical protein